ncbi:hypothetical protein CEXT_545501 [Caerostris extrusa]|uniref:Uncharacterized protein n=1 Tax=Caerostris extrusa TaxID=172846 RepID=A0AAV4NDE0_CAEEX|nr:hypothetical protein CEXT_545501 [Caerostris extrusa]
MGVESHEIRLPQHFNMRVVAFGCNSLPVVRHSPAMTNHEVLQDLRKIIQPWCVPAISSVQCLGSLGLQYTLSVAHLFDGKARIAKIDLKWTSRKNQFILCNSFHCLSPAGLTTPFRGLNVHQILPETKPRGIAFVYQIRSGTLSIPWEFSIESERNQLLVKEGAKTKSVYKSPSSSIMPAGFPHLDFFHRLGGQGAAG